MPATKSLPGLHGVDRIEVGIELKDVMIDYYDAGDDEDVYSDELLGTVNK